MGVLFSRLPTSPDPHRAAHRLTTRPAGVQVAPEHDDPSAVDTGELVARALKILADDTTAWQARAAATRACGRAR